MGKQSRKYGKAARRQDKKVRLEQEKKIADEAKMILNLRYKEATKKTHEKNKQDLINWLKENEDDNGVPSADTYIDDDGNVKWEELPFDTVVQPWLQSHRTDGGDLKSISVLKKLRSTITHKVSEENEKTMPTEYTMAAKKFFQGIKKLHAQKKADGTITDKVGKDRMPEKLYSELCASFIRDSNASKQGVFANAFLTCVFFSPLYYVWCD